jgi:hypothetical protein
VPTAVTATATFNGVTLTQNVTVDPAVPLTIVGLSGNINGPQALLNPNTIHLFVNMNRTNLSPAIITFTSSNPAVAQVPASLTIPALTVPGDFRVVTISIPIQPVSVDTPITISGSFNGVTVTQTFTLPKMVDVVKIGKQPERASVFGCLAEGPPGPGSFEERLTTNLGRPRPTFYAHAARLATTVTNSAGSTGLGR